MPADAPRENAVALARMLEHEEDCLPVRPCRLCQAAEHLRRCLSEHDYNTFVALLIDGIPKAAAESPVSVLTLSRRARNVLAYQDIRSIGQLCTMTELDLLRMGRFGPKTVREIRIALGKIGLSLRPEQR